MRIYSLTPLAKGNLGEPLIGDIRYASEFGKHYNSKLIYVECPVCKNTRWSHLVNYNISIGRGRNGICPRCYGLSRRGKSNWWLKGKPFTREHKLHLSQALKGRASPFKGKKLPPRTSEHSRKIAESLKGRLSPCRGRQLQTRGSLAKGTIEKPIVGDIRWGDELGKGQVSTRYMFVRCPDCNGTRWAEFKLSENGYSTESIRLCFHCFRARGQAKMRMLWSKREFKEKMVEKLRRACGTIKPTKPERIVSGILENVCPNEYEYVGDGAVVIGGLIPDFININGQKKVIEVFGDYWHGKEKTGRARVDEEIVRVKSYKQFGFKCLIIWEHEIQNNELVKAHIKEFSYENL